MKTQQSQIKINLPVQLKDFAQSKANKFGLPLASYVKHLILKEVENFDLPSFQVSEKTEKAYQKAIINKQLGLGIKVKDIDKFFKGKFR